MHAVRRPIHAAVPLALLAGLKLLLISHDEVTAFGFDERTVAQAALGWYWGQPYSHEAFVRQPTYPLWVALTMALGIPARLAIEALWALASWVLFRALVACGAHRVAAAAAATLVFFHPWTLRWFNHLLQDTFYAPVALMFFAALAVVVARAGAAEARRWAMLALVTGPVAATTRPEPVLLFAELAAAALLILGLNRLGLCTRRRAASTLIAGVLAPALAITALTEALKQANASTIGVRVTTDLLMPGLTRLYDTLLSIRPDHPDPALPIPRDVRERAYALSPTFASWREYIDGDRRLERFNTHGRNLTGVEGEPSGWAIWVIRSAAWRSADPPPASAAEFDALFARAADELQHALASGEVPTRTVPISRVPPEWRLIAARLPEDLWRAGRLILLPGYRPTPVPEFHGPYGRAIQSAAQARFPQTLALDGKPVDNAPWYAPRTLARFEAAKRLIARAYHPVMIAAAIVAAAGLGLALWRLAVRRSRPAARPLAAAAILLTALAARILLVALLGVCGIPVQERYLLVCPPLLLALAALSTARPGAALRTGPDEAREAAAPTRRVAET